MSLYIFEYVILLTLKYAVDQHFKSKIYINIPSNSPVITLYRMTLSTLKRILTAKYKIGICNKGD